jgi:hypothetical protein
MVVTIRKLPAAVKASTRRSFSWKVHSTKQRTDLPNSAPTPLPVLRSAEQYEVFFHDHYLEQRKPLTAMRFMHITYVFPDEPSEPKYWQFASAIQRYHLVSKFGYDL